MQQAYVHTWGHMCPAVVGKPEDNYHPLPHSFETGPLTAPGTRLQASVILSPTLKALGLQAHTQLHLAFYVVAGI